MKRKVWILTPVYSRGVESPKLYGNVLILSKMFLDIIQPDQKAIKDSIEFVMLKLGNHTLQ